LTGEKSKPPVCDPRKRAAFGHQVLWGHYA
jgi:hypothetical protein